MTEPELFPDVQHPQTLGGPTQREVPSRSIQVQRSALWAAYGDALGWISELTNEAGLRKRTSGEPLCKPVEWTRRVGGRGGVVATMPRGCYSDDSQLRLATGRAIRPDAFDVEAFAKVELPVWLSYALGAGKSTSAAAANLAKPKVPWFCNTFKGWTNSGGNGAAMRVQPHVWAASTPGEPASFLSDVVRNAICTHSNPCGLMGAVIHSLALAHTVSAGTPPTPEDLIKAVDLAASLPDQINNDQEVGNYWRAAFEREAGNFGEAWTRVVDETREAIRLAGALRSGVTGAARYDSMIETLGLRKPTKRGSGLLTAVAATGLTWCEERPEEALRIAANSLGTDTDTIATMTGAILGALAAEEPPVEVLDASLFRSEANRLAKIGLGAQPRSHRYPDLLHWSAPESRADALLCSEGGDLHVLGLGSAVAKTEPMASRQDGFSWQWLHLEIGQTIFIKRRKHPTHDGGVRAQPATRPSPLPDNGGKRGVLSIPTDIDFPSRPSKPLDLQKALDYVREHKGDDRIVGRALRRLVNEGTIGEIAAFTASLIDLLRQPEPPVRHVESDRISEPEPPSHFTESPTRDSETNEGGNE